MHRLAQVVAGGGQEAGFLLAGVERALLFLLELLGQPAAFALQLDGAHQRLLQVQRVARQHQRVQGEQHLHVAAVVREGEIGQQYVRHEDRHAREDKVRRDGRLRGSAARQHAEREQVQHAREHHGAGIQVQQRRAAPGQAGEEGDGAHVVPPLARVR
ncbi:hypothetical protein D3C81_1368480 [compost metagenome]